LIGSNRLVLNPEKGLT